MTVKRKYPDAFYDTINGRRVHLIEPEPSTIDIDDIAHALSRLPRWNGHMHMFWSVAHHSLLVSYLCDPGDSLCGLLHDAAEAYIGDMPDPLKRVPDMLFYRRVEDHLIRVIQWKFGLRPGMPESVKLADRMALNLEQQVMRTIHKPPWKWQDDLDAQGLESVKDVVLKVLPWSTPEEIRREFLHRAMYLMNGDGHDKP